MRDRVVAELKVLGFGLWQMFVEYVTSKKVLTFVLTSVAGMVIKDPNTREWIVGSGIALIIGQGAADFGKAKPAPVVVQATPLVVAPAPPPLGASSVPGR